MLGSLDQKQSAQVNKTPLTSKYKSPGQTKYKNTRVQKGTTRSKLTP